MRKLQGKLMWAIVRPFLLGVLVFLPFSAATCHAMSCDPANVPPHPTLTSITPPVWVPGQTYHVVITGNLTGNAPDPPDGSGGCTYDELTLSSSDGVYDLYYEGYGVGEWGTGSSYLTISKQNQAYISPTQVGFTVTIAPDAPAETIILTAGCDGCDYRVSGPVSIAAGSASNLGACSQCQSQAGAPINLTNGNVWVEQRDYSLPGLGGGLGLVRTWNSLSGSFGPSNGAGMFGQGWRSTYEEMLAGPDSNNNLTYWHGDGGAWTFTYSSVLNSYTLTSPPNERAQLVANPTGGFTLTLADHTQKVFNGQNLLAAIIDRNNNQTTIAYDGSNRVTSVTSPGGGTITFTYGDSNNPMQATKVQDPVGTVATYTYDSSSRLTLVTYPDGSALNFSYDTNSMILSVTDSQGKLLEAHTYDAQNRGLTSTRANGVDSVSVVY